jgi:hypothetical protein
VINQSATLLDARTTIEVLSDRLTHLLPILPHAHARIPGSTWSLHQATAHLIRQTTLYTELALGADSPLTEFTPTAVTRFNAQHLADIAHTHPSALATALTAATDRFVEATTHRNPTTPVSFHAGIPLDLTRLTTILVREYLLHGYDITRTTATPWPITPDHAALALHGHHALSPHTLNPTTTGEHTARYQLRLGTAGTLTAQFTHGNLQLTTDPAPYPRDDIDCVITADPVAYLLISSGRITQWTAITLGLLTTTGPHPHLGLRLGTRFHQF